MRASELIPHRDYPSFPEFERFGLPVHLVDAEVLRVLQRIRDISQIPIIPSPIRAGWARTNGATGSRHYAVGRLSDAGDIFPARGRCLECWLRAQEIPALGALGLYSDTRGVDGLPWTMLHFDLRDAKPRVFWIREAGEYLYLNRDPVSFWRAFKYIISRGS